MHHLKAQELLNDLTTVLKSLGSFRLDHGLNFLVIPCGNKTIEIHNCGILQCIQISKGEEILDHFTFQDNNQTLNDIPQDVYNLYIEQKIKQEADLIALATPMAKASTKNNKI